MPKIRLLVWADYVCNTGFGNVTRNIVSNLDKTGDFSIDVVGINYDGDPYDAAIWPGRVFPALRGRASTRQYNDVFGRQRVLDLLALNDYDVLFAVQDTFLIKEFSNALFQTLKNVSTKFVYYFPIDATPHQSWIEEVVSKADFPIAYTEYAKNEIIKVDPSLNEMPVIYHGTNTDEFYPVDVKDFRHDYFKGLADGRFLIMNLNRNQPRKDVLRSLLILKELKDRGENPLLYLHMSGIDVGGDIDQWAEQLGLKNEQDYICPPTIGDGLPVSVVNQLYNAADCVLTTTHGEGWGLSITEAMATKTPVIAPDCTSLREMLADNRGILVSSGKTNHDWYCSGQFDNNRLRPLMDVSEAADEIEKLMDGKTPDVEAAYGWATSQTWQSKTKEFEKIIRLAASARPKPVVPITLNRAQRRKLARA